MDRDVQKTCPSETGGRIQSTAQTSSLLKDEGKGRALQSNNHILNPFDILDSLLVKLSDENNELSRNQGIVLVISDSQIKDASEMGMKKVCDNNTHRKRKVKRKDLSQPRNQKHDEFQITNHLSDQMVMHPCLLTQFPEAKEQDQNQVIGNSRPPPSSLDPYHTLMPMNAKQEIGGKVLTNFSQKFGLEEGQSKEPGVLGSSLADYRSTDNLQLDVPANINLPHSSSHLEILPSPQTDLSNEQQKEPEVEVRRKKKKKENEVGEFLKRNKEESFQRKVQNLLQIVEIMENIVQNLINGIRQPKT